MPEMKRNFTGGKMNKDLDERLIPQGEYINAMNIQVTTSEGSDIGTVQNIAGNSRGCQYQTPIVQYDENGNPIVDNTASQYYTVQSTNPIPYGSSTVASISDEKNDSLYWFVTSGVFAVPQNLQAGQSVSFKDLIMRTNNNASQAPSGCEPVFVDKWAFCTHNDNTGNTNSLFLSDTTMYSEVFAGMSAIGYADNGTELFNATVLGVDNESTLSTSYSSGSMETPNPQFVQNQGPNSTGPGLRLRTFDIGYSCNFTDPYTGGIKSVTAGITNEYLPGPNQYQFWLPSGVIDKADPTTLWDPPPSGLTVGATLKIRNANSGNNISAAQFDANGNFIQDPAVTVVSVQQVNIVTAPCTNNSSTQQVYLITVEGYSNGLYMYPNWVDFVANDPCGEIDPATGIAYGTPPPADPALTYSPGLSAGPTLNMINGCTDVNAINFDYNAQNNDGTCAYCTPSDSQLNTYEAFDFEVTAPPTNSLVPNNEIILDSSQSNISGFLTQMYGIFYDVSGVLVSNVQAKINSSGAGINWPPGSCIDPATIPPPPYSGIVNVSIVECSANVSTPVDPSALVYPFNFNTGSLQLSFSIFGELENIILSDTVNTDQVSTICFKSERVLNFDPSRLITGVNIIDDLLFWTDNFTEPKKINIDKSIIGTDSGGNTHTNFINPSTQYSERVQEDDITVIKKAPINKLNLDINTGRNIDFTYSGIIKTSLTPTGSTSNSSIIDSSNPTVVENFSGLAVGDTVQLHIPTDINGDTDFTLKWLVGDFLLLKEFVQNVAPSTPIANETIRCVIKGWTYQDLTSDSSIAPVNFSGNQWDSTIDGVAVVEVEILSINGIVPVPTVGSNTINGIDELDYVIDLEQKEEPIFENKFPRFSYRYQYQDGEYSAFAPFSEVAFFVGSFGFDPQYGFNTAMVNSIREITLSNFTNNLPPDVEKIDILYKEEGSPNVYIVETISATDPLDIGGGKGLQAQQPTNSWLSDSYVITSETIKSTVESNQLLRPWDNVPKKALAQDVTGNRIVYGNYEQNFDLGNFKPNFKNHISDWGIEYDSSGILKSIKSLREYKLGVVFTDEHGRETPILVGKNGGFKVSKKISNKNNRLNVGLNGQPPLEAEYFKFFVKETSTEYYNLAMDRWYDAEDGNIWIAFPSSDINKVDLETTLFLKKGNENAIKNTSKYKILAIEEQAPEFIQMKKVRIGGASHFETSSEIFGNSLTNAPKVNNISFQIDYNAAGFQQSSLSHLEDIKDDLFVNFRSLEGVLSKMYKVSEITSDRDATTAPFKYFVTLEISFRNDIDFIYDDPTSPTKIKDGISIQFTKSIKESSGKFEGRFFAKIPNDGEIKFDIAGDLTNINVVQTASKMVYSLGDEDVLRQRAQQSWYHPVDGTSEYVVPSFAPPSGGNAPSYQYYLPEFFPTNWIKLEGDFANQTQWQYNTGGSYQNYLGTTLNQTEDGLDQYRDLNVRQCYFGRIPTLDGAPATYESKLTDDGVASTDTFDPSGPKPSFEDGVWFIDKSFHYATGYDEGDPYKIYWRHKSTLDLSQQDYPFGDPAYFEHHHPHYKTGIEDISSGQEFTMQLSFGGFGYKKWYEDGIWKDWKLPSTGVDPVNYNTNDFFDIGNNAERGGDHGQFVKKIEPGFNFRWKDDPKQNVYTITQTKTANVCRYDVNAGGWDNGTFMSAIPMKHFLANPASYIKTWKCTVEKNNQGVAWNPNVLAGTAIPGGLRLGSKLNQSSYDITTTNTSDIVTMNPAGSIPSELQVGMTVDGTDIPLRTKIESINNNTNEIKLSNPATGSANISAEIGFTIRAVNSGNLSSWDKNSGDPYITIDTKLAACEENLGNYLLHKGMRLSSYNNGVIIPGGDFQASFGGPNVIIKKLEPLTNGNVKVFLTGYTSPLIPTDVLPTAFIAGEKLVFEQVGMNDVSNHMEDNSDVCKDYWEPMNMIVTNDGTNADTAGIGAVGYELEIVEYVEEYAQGGNLPPDPFVWETEPKGDNELDIYYEISESNPLELNPDTMQDAIPIGSTIDFLGYGINGTSIVLQSYFLNGAIIRVNNFVYVGSAPNANGISGVGNGYSIKVTKPNGVAFETTIQEPINVVANQTTEFKISPSLYNAYYSLNWHNCYSFGNGVESNRIRDNFNLPFIINGVKASTTLGIEYKKERRKYGLIYSGIYNSTSGVNNLNQFIVAEKITKEINPLYGSIQKIHSGWGASGDLIALCEDRVLKILANKDALFNADGNSNVTATNRVLGAATPYAGEYGISKNPESFASYSYRAYFTDQVRGKVLRLSKDGLTPISDFGMKDWFRDNLKVNYTVAATYAPGHPNYVPDMLLGSYDDKKQSYNLTLKMNAMPKSTVTFQEDVKGWVSFKSYIPQNAISCNNEYYSFDKGNLWLHHNQAVDRNTFYGVHQPSSVKLILNDQPGIVKTFHTLNYEGSQSKINKLFSYDTFDYTSWNGQDAYTNVTNTYVNNEHYNLEDKEGWYVSYIKSGLNNKEFEEGSLNEFIKKEGKWFNYIKGKTPTLNDFGSSGFDSADISFQGIGILQTAGQNLLDLPGCTNPTALNYNAAATVDNGTCIAAINGCMEPLADNYDPDANVPGICVYLGCTDPAYVEFNPQATNDDGSCATLQNVGCMDTQILNGYPLYYNSSNTYTSPCDGTNGPACVSNYVNCCCVSTSLGCMDSTAFNYDSLANTDDGSCIPVALGCTDAGATNYDPAANSDDGSCNYLGCTDATATNYNANATTDDGSCNYDVYGCTDPIAINYDSAATIDDGSCDYTTPITGCMDEYYNNTNTLSYNYNSAATIPSTQNYFGLVNGCYPVVLGCTDPTANNYITPATPSNQNLTTNVNTDDGSCVAVVSGCLYQSATNYDPNANTSILPNVTSITVGGITINVSNNPVPVSSTCTFDDWGCTDPLACNYDSTAGFTFNSMCDYTTCAGCTDPTADNYNPSATIDDNSCTFTAVVDGCMDPNATNYDSSATVDDNSCTYFALEITSLSSTTTTTGKWGALNAIIIEDFLCHYTGSPDANGNAIDFGAQYNCSPGGTAGWGIAKLDDTIFKQIRNGAVVYSGQFMTYISTSAITDNVNINTGDAVISRGWDFSQPASQSGNFEIGDLIIGPGHPDY